MAHADDPQGSPPPFELITAYQIRNWGPGVVGGPIGIGALRRMEVYMMYHEAVQRYRRAVGDQIHNLSDQDRIVIADCYERGWL